MSGEKEKSSITAPVVPARVDPDDGPYLRALVGANEERRQERKDRRQDRTMAASSAASRLARTGKRATAYGPSSGARR
jgi:hypothetical protein